MVTGSLKPLFEREGLGSDPARGRGHGWSSMRSSGPARGRSRSSSWPSRHPRTRLRLEATSQSPTHNGRHAGQAGAGVRAQGRPRRGAGDPVARHRRPCRLADGADPRVAGRGGPAPPSRAGGPGDRRSPAVQGRGPARPQAGGGVDPRRQGRAARWRSRSSRSRCAGCSTNGREITHARARWSSAIDTPRASGISWRPSCFPMSADPEEIYHRILFHGPAMQAIQRVEGCDDRAIARLGLDLAPALVLDRAAAPPELADRPAGHRRGVPAARALDAGSGSGRTRCRRPWAVIGNIGGRSPPRASASWPSSSAFSDHRAVADIEFLDAQGELVARIEAYECVIDPSLNQAFRRNRLTHREVAPS